jgi:hypothetical protein
MLEKRSTCGKRVGLAGKVWDVGKRARVPECNKYMYFILPKCMYHVSKVNGRFISMTLKWY